MIDEKITKAHQAEIVDDFLSRDLHAECSCGWEGRTAANQHLALAEHTAHVYNIALQGLESAADGGEYTP